MFDEPWFAEAACRPGRGVDPDLFFPDGDVSHDLSPRGQHALAKEVCGTCPVIYECLEYALSNGISHGVWGGLGPIDRSRLKRSETG